MGCLSPRERAGVRARRAAPLRATMADEAARPPARLPWGAAPPTPPSRTSTLRRSGPPTRPRISFLWGALPPRPPWAVACGAARKGAPEPPEAPPVPSPRGRGRAARRRGQRAHGGCEGAATVSRAVRPPLPSRERAGVRGSDARRAKPSMADEAEAARPSTYPGFFFLWGAPPPRPRGPLHTARPSGSWARGPGSGQG